MNESIQRFSALLEQNPANDLARFSLAKAYLDLGQFKEAQAEFAQCLQRKPTWMMAQIFLGKCDLALGNKHSAKAAFIRGRELAIAQNHEGPAAEMDELIRDLSASL